MKSKSYFRLVSLVLSIVMLSLCAISSSAFSENSHDFLEDKFEFISPNPMERINSDGTFTFLFRHTLTSGKFTANSNTIRIDTGAQVYDAATKEYYNDSNVLFTVTLYKSTGVRVGTYLASADDAYGGISYPVTKGAKYYLYFESQTDFTGTGKYISGWGEVSPVTVS